MKLLTFVAGLLSLSSTALSSSSSSTGADDSTATAARASKVLLPATFTPPQVFKNANLVHILSLEKNYAKEAINVLIENIAKTPQDEYFIPFTIDQMSRIGAFEVKDRKDANAGPFEVHAVEFDPQR